MEKHIVKVLAIDDITHNVKRFIVEKPTGYTYIPGQATDVAIKQPGLENELRPFTFTSLPTADYLEFIIKIYNGHSGITRQLGNLQTGDELIIHEVFGAIQYKGPGIFIAAGAGITPFIAILRHLRQRGDLNGNVLLFSNHTIGDIILNDELKDLLGERCIDILSIPPPGAEKMLIDKELIAACLNHTANWFYICGPEQFTLDMVGILHKLGVSSAQIIIEQ